MLHLSVSIYPKLNLAFLSNNNNAYHNPAHNSAVPVLLSLSTKAPLFAGNPYHLIVATLL